MNKEFADLLTKHMMRSVNDRYAVLKRLGLEERLLTLLSVEGPAWVVAVKVADTVQSWYNEKQVEAFCDKLKTFGLPEWMSTE